MKTCGAFILVLSLLVGCSKTSADSDTTERETLPEDPSLAQFTLRTEGIFDLVLELRGLTRDRKNHSPESDRRVLELWEKMVDTLPEDDLLLQRIAGNVAKYFLGRDALKVAQINEYDNPDWAASLYEELGRLADAARMEAKGERYRRREEELWEWHAGLEEGGGDIKTWLDGQPVADRLSFLTTGVSNPWARGGDRGFGYSVASLPDNARLRRAMTLYYFPCRDCGLSSFDGGLDVSEPILRLTAEAFPQRLGETYRLVVAAGHGQYGWHTGPYRIPGDFSPTGNALVLTRDLLRLAPDARKGILAVARAKSREAVEPPRRCRWQALVAYLEDGAPDPGEEAKQMLMAKLAGTPPERRWALAWIPNELAESAPDPYPYVTDRALGEAIAAAAAKCQTPEDRILALDALGIVPPISGLEFICQMAGSEEPGMAEMAITAILTQYRRAQPLTHDEESRLAIQPNEDFVAALPALREAFYPHLPEQAWKRGEDLMHMFAELGDPGLDAEVAGRVGRDGFDRANHVRDIVLTARWYPGLEWGKTITAIESLGQDPSYEHADYAARLAREWRAGTW